MTTATTFPKVATVEALPGKRLLVGFRNGIRKVYDCNHLLTSDAFRPLANEPLFRAVRPDPNGYAVIWTDEIDLAESELWLHGELADA